MRCPFCLNEESKVIDKRDAGDVEVVRRRRECLKCEKRFTTYERVEIDLRILKKDGRRETYSREKLKQGIVKSCEKRPVSAEKIDEMINRIEVMLKGKASEEVSSSIIGELTMRELKKVDKVAYIRFASVYKDFADAESFAKELKLLVKA